MAELTKADVAKKVKRLVQVIGEDKKPVFNKDGSPKMDEVAIKESEVFSFKDYGDHVVVVTVDGQKFNNKK